MASVYTAIIVDLDLYEAQYLWEEPAPESAYILKVCRNDPDKIVKICRIGIASIVKVERENIEG